MITGNKHNIVNVDALHKYHTGVNTPNISEELVNENVTSFKVGTSNVNGVDLTNQMEQSLVDVTYIEGKTVKENSKLNSVKVVFDSGEKELYSLQGEFFDEYKNGKHHKKVKKLTVKDFTRGGALCGTNAGWQQDKGTYGFYFNHIAYDCIEETAIECNYLDHIFYQTMVDGTAPGITLSSEWGWMAFRVDNATLGITSSDGNVQKLQKAEEWFFNSNIEIHYLINEAITDESITILANPNEEINVVSGTPTTIKHTVQLNTKAQVEETQKQIVESNKSIWQRLKTLTDVEMRLEQNGYIKLPTILGGLILQWGTILNDKIPNVGNSSYINYNTHFTDFPYFISLTPDALAGLDDRIYSTVNIKTHNFGIACNGGTKTNNLTTLKWFAIGK